MRSPWIIRHPPRSAWEGGLGRRPQHRGPAFATEGHDHAGGRTRPVLGQPGHTGHDANPVRRPHVPGRVKGVVRGGARRPHAVTVARRSATGTSGRRARHQNSIAPLIDGTRTSHLFFGSAPPRKSGVTIRKAASTNLDDIVVPRSNELGVTLCSG